MLEVKLLVVSPHSWLWLCTAPPEQHDGRHPLRLPHVHGKCPLSVFCLLSCLTLARCNPGMLLTPGSRGHHVTELRCQGWPVEYRNHRVSVPDWESPFSSEYCYLNAFWHRLVVHHKSFIIIIDACLPQNWMLFCKLVFIEIPID